jgi:hypothetical protein
MSTPTVSKPFNELTQDEARDLVRECKRGENSVEAIKANLTKAGFNGSSAMVCVHSTPCGRMSMAMVLVYGPRHRIISC